MKNSKGVEQVTSEYDDDDDDEKLSVNSKCVSSMYL